MSLDVLCVGLIVADHVCAPLPYFPPAGALIRTDRLELTIGGSAANVAVDVARLGLTSALAGRVGDDVLGRYVVESLSAQGVRCDTVTVSPTTHTSATLVVNVVGEDRRFLHAVGANAEFTGREIDAAVLQTCRAVCVGGFGLNPALSGSNVAELFRTVRRAGGVTVLDVVVGDPAILPAMLRDALPETDLFLPNVDESRLILGETEPARQAAQFRGWGAKTVIVTQGGRGTHVLGPDGVLTADAYPVDCIDGTGGGDAFVSGYVYGLLKGADPATCLRYGAAMGASCVRSMGATNGVFDRQQLEEFVADHPLRINRG